MGRSRTSKSRLETRLQCREQLDCAGTTNWGAIVTSNNHLDTGTHVNIVLYGFDADAFGTTAESLKAIAPQIDRINVLLSGSRQDLNDFEATVDKNGLLEHVVCTHRFDNLGFSAGHNLLLHQAFESGASACLVLNPDIYITPEGLRSLLTVSAGYPRALIGPTLAQLDPGREQFPPHSTDSLGISWNADARHFDMGLGAPWRQQAGDAYPVQGITGACMLVQKAVHDRIRDRSGHFFDPLFIAYREDAELGIRAHAGGVESMIAPVNGISHIRSQRGFKRTNPLVNLLGVRNRFLIRWTLGKSRPGSPTRATLRDLIVILATLTIERNSIPGLMEAWRVRRYCRSMRDV